VDGDAELDMSGQFLLDVAAPMLAILALPGMTALTPPRGSSTSPRYRGMTCIWRWKIVCPAVSPTLIVT
jgi:hypothetical protein